MNFDEYTDEELKKRRHLKNIEIDEISLVDKGANRKKFLVVKSADGETFESIVDKFLKTESDFGDTEEIFKDEKGLIAAAKKLLSYVEDIPGDMKSAIDAIMKKLLTSLKADYGYPEKVQKSDPSDPWPSVYLLKAQQGLGVFDEDAEKEAEEELEEIIENCAEPEKLIELMKSMPLEEARNLVKTKPVKKSIEDDGGEDFEDPDSLDPWPSVIDPRDFL